VILQNPHAPRQLPLTASASSPSLTVACLYSWTPINSFRFLGVKCRCYAISPFTSELFSYSSFQVLGMSSAL
jgi:hypothetical protein